MQMFMIDIAEEYAIEKAWGHSFKSSNPIGESF